MERQPLYEIVLRAEPHPVDAVIRLRMLLRRALRDHALRCVGVLQLQPKRTCKMKVSEEFNKYYRASDITAPITKTISGVSVELLGEERERNLVVRFSEPGPALVAKPARRGQLVDLFGDDTDAWIGQKVVLYTAMVSFGRERVQSIQVGAPKGQQQPRRRQPRTVDEAIAMQAPIDADPDLADDPVS
jgi:hypothetical protein